MAVNHTTSFFTELHLKCHCHCKVTSHKPHLAERPLHHSLHVAVTTSVVTFQRVNLITSKTAGQGTRHTGPSSQTMFPELPTVFQQYCTVGTANKLWDGQSGLRILTGTRDFLLYQNCPNQIRAHPDSLSMDTGHSFPKGKAAGTWSWPLTSI